MIAARSPRERSKRVEPHCPQAPSPGLIAQFAEIVGPAHALTDPDAQLPYLREWRDTYFGRAAAVLRPGSTEEVSRILALANEHRIAVVPQAGNTGLVGGQVPFEHGHEIVVSVARLDRIRSLDAAGNSMVGRSRRDAGRRPGRRRPMPAACSR